MWFFSLVKYVGITFYHKVDYSNRINYANEYAESPNQARISEVAESRRGPNQKPNTLVPSTEKHPIYLK